MGPTLSPLLTSLWDPPRAAESGARKTTYQTSLAQAEDLFSAARKASPMVCPLLVFYGLRQGDRAVAAATASAHGSEWQLVGHGIAVDDTKAILQDLKLKTSAPGSSTSFVRLPELLGSPVWGPNAVVPFVEAWDSSPVNWHLSQALHDDVRQRRRSLDLDP